MARVGPAPVGEGEEEARKVDGGGGIEDREVGARLGHRARQLRPAKPHVPARGGGRGQRPPLRFLFCFSRSLPITLSVNNSRLPLALIARLSPSGLLRTSSFA